MKKLFEDSWIIAIDKEPGLLSVPGRGAEKQDCALSRLLKNDEVFVIHRLDQATSGLLLFAKSKEAQKQFSRLFEKRKIQKNYITIVQGCPEQENGTINYSLSPDWPNRPKQKVDRESGKKAHTDWELLYRDKSKNISRLILRPRTGRTHQLRVHLSAIGHPVIGDRLYNPDFNEEERLFLHAESLEFVHPYTHQLTSINCPPAF